MPWKSQSLYVRLLTRVDDFGRHDGRVRICDFVSNCFSVRNDINPHGIVELQQVVQMFPHLSVAKGREFTSRKAREVMQLLLGHERIRSGVKKMVAG